MVNAVVDLVQQAPPDPIWSPVRLLTLPCDVVGGEERERENEYVYLNMRARA